MKLHFRFLFVATVLLSASASNAALVDRGGGFIYDDVQDITWLQDANFAKTSGYDADGRMLHSDAMAWADGLSVYDSVRNVTYDDWRLPTTLQPDASCSVQDGRSYGRDCSGSEMGHLYYVDAIRAGSSVYYDELLTITNVEVVYWSNSFEANVDFAWRFNFVTGTQRTELAIETAGVSYSAWAVRDGDVAASAVPIPAAVWLFGSGLGVLGWLRRRQLLSPN